MREPKYKRVLLKISGEALAGDAHRGLDFAVIGGVCDVIKQCVEAGVQVGVVVGGGNFWRGVKDGGGKMERTRADHMGMLATVINALALSDALDRQGVDNRVMTALAIDKIGEPYNVKTAKRYLSDGKVVVFGGGTGSPFFTTDTGASLKACEIQAEVLLLAKNIDGIYDSDPKTNPNAKKFDTLTYDEYVEKGLRALDTSAVVMCKENGLKIHAFGNLNENSIVNAVFADSDGTVVY